MPGYWNLKSDIEVKHEITNQLSIKSLDFIGRYIKHTNGFTFFDNIRLPNFSPLPKIKSNKDDKLANAKVIVQRKDLNLKNGSYYHFTSKVIPQNQRVKHNNEFLFTVENDSEITEYKPVAKKFIDSIYERFDKADSANNNDISKALNTITYQINKKPETFIYELLQNADDNAVKDVNVTFYITEKYLLVFHNGEPFKFNNVFAICSVNAEDKSDDIDKIGFKGIGFKSVFKDNDWVFINSGEYSFRFDQSKYSVEKPWQLMPIWTPIDEDLEISLRNNERFLSENVSIALRPKDNNAKLLSKYSKTLELFNDDRILLFLKKVRQVHVSLQNKEKIHCRKNNAIWGKREYTITVNSEIKTWLNEQIRNNNQEVPIKYQDIDKFRITYAYKADNNKVIPLVDSTLFNYLPLSISLGFPFLVNSDFIPDGDREELYLNAWNEYLMIEIGRNVPIFISDIVRQKIDSFHLLPESAKNNFLNSKWNQLYEWFLQGYVESLNGDKPIAFIPTKYGSLESLANILIDETGLAELLGDEFSQLTGISEKLIDSNVGEGVEKIKDLIKQNDVGVIYDKDRLKDDIQTKLQDWLKKPSNNFKFIQYLNSSDALKGLLKSEEIILSESLILHKASALYFEVPKEINFLAVDKVNSEVLTLLTDSKINLSLTEFEPVDFFKNNILSKQENINASLADETNLLNFWKFIFDNWTLFEADTAIKDSFKHFVVLCKPKTENELSKKVISSAYLSNEFNSTNDIEIVVKDISPDEVFISDKYIDKKREAEKWRKIFKQAGAITDLQKVIEVLLPKLPIIESAKHLEIAKQIFKFWKDPANKLTDAQIVLIKTNLNIKCVDKKFRKSTDCIISDHYNNNQLIASWLPNLELANQVAQEYAPRTNQVAEWKNFFVLIGCVELTDKQNVFEAKIDFIITAQDELREKHFELLKTISDLHRNKKENGLSFNFEKCLSHIKLQTNNDEWHLPNQIHLSNIYKPKLSLQNDDAINSTFHFLNEKYIPTEIQKYFLTDIGVNDGFYFKKIIPIIHIDKVQEHKFVSQLESIERYRLRLQEIKKMTSKDAKGYIVRSYPDDKIRLNTYVTNHLLVNYPQLLLIPKYSELFLKFVIKDKNIDILSTETEIKIWNNNVYKHPNYIAWLLQTQSELENQLAEFVKPTELFSFNLDNYIANKAELPKINYSTQIAENGKSLEELLGIQQMLKISHCIELLSRIENRISYEEIIQLQIVEILSGYSPTYDEKPKLFLLNQNLEWKAINELFISTDDKFQIEPTQNLHEDFYPIAECFGVQELSEENLVLKTSPKTPSVADEIESFFGSKAKFIGFKIDHLNYEEVEAIIIEKINQIVFYEVTSISKVFPEVKPIYKTEIAFHFEVDENKIFYKGNWKTNSELKLYLHKHILEEKIPEAWFENVINRWDERKIIETLIDMFGFVPEDWVLDNEEEEKPIEEKFENPFKDIKPDDETFIRGIIKGDFELNEKLDANTTAKIKTLMAIKGQYNAVEIIDEGRFLKAGADEIIVRSAQSGLLYLDVYHWGRLGESNVSLSIYTKSQIEIFKTQEDLIEHTKPQNKFGIVRMPDEYDVDDYNSLDNINDKGKWHYVFIVNENTKAAQNYKEVINLDEYNF